MRTKKSLGQHFLKSKLALRKIIQAGEISGDDVILEIGPGKGILTEELLKCSGQVIAVEKDRELFEFLQNKFRKEVGEKKLVLINDDILKFNARAYGLEPSAYKIISNIPYNITGAILKKFLSGEHQPERMVLLVQKEVAERIIGRGPRRKVGVNKESILSISVKAYGEPEMIGKVPARYFSPVPKVDSAILVIKNISREFFNKNNIEEERFWEIVKKGFAHKRKKLSGNLKEVCQGAPLTSGLGDKRAEDLTIEDWISLSRP